MTFELKLSESLGVANKSQRGQRRRAKLIAADIWGSTAYYPAEVLERDGPRVFHAGLQMFEDHLTESEKYDRPEGSVAKLVGKLITDAVFEADGVDGPGLYADIEFYESYLSRINEIADDIGLSVRVNGLVEDGEMQGRYGPIAVGLLAATSVDIVTKAGAGGRLISILESDKGLAGTPIQEKQGALVSEVTLKDFEAFAVSLKEGMAALAESVSTALAEAAKPVEPAVEDEGEEDKVTEVEIDHAAVITAVTDAELPAEAVTPIVQDIKAGTELAEAVSRQVKYRDALAASQETGTVVLQESSKKATGLAYAVEVLG